MTMRRTGVLAGAALLVFAGMAQAKTIDIAPPPPAPAKQVIKPEPAPRIPVHTARKPARTRSVRSVPRVYYDYYAAREVSEDIQVHPRDRDARRDDAFDSRQAPPPDSRSDTRPEAQIDSRDFNGGVGYGQNGDMGYSGANDRFDPNNGNTSMNGGGMANAAAARFSVWHGYNGRNGLRNGY